MLPSRCKLYWYGIVCQRILLFGQLKGLLHNWNNVWMVVLKMGCKTRYRKLIQRGKLGTALNNSWVRYQCICFIRWCTYKNYINIINDPWSPFSVNLLPIVNSISWKLQANWAPWQGKNKVWLPGYKTRADLYGAVCRWMKLSTILPIIWLNELFCFSNCSQDV